LSDVQESASLSIGLEHHGFSLTESLVSSNILANSGLFDFGRLLDFVLIPLGFSSEDTLLGDLRLLDGIFVIVRKIDRSKLEEDNLAVKVLLEPQVEVVLHLFRNVCTHGEKVIGRESCRGVTDRVNGHPQQNIHHFITVLGVDFIDLIRNDSKLKRNF
jgi:hypothetical protein